MKLSRFIFRDFWRKLVALIFAVVIYWQVGESVKRERSSAGSAPRIKIEHIERKFPVRMLDRGVAGKRVCFARGSVPEVRVTLGGAKKDVTAVRDGDLLFYVDADDLKDGRTSLPVRWHVRRAGIGVVEVSPAGIKVEIR